MKRLPGNEWLRSQGEPAGFTSQGLPAPRGFGSFDPLPPPPSVSVVGLGEDCRDITQVGVSGGELARLIRENRTFAAGI